MVDSNLALLAKAVAADYKKLAGVPSYATALSGLYQTETNLYNLKASNTRRMRAGLARANRTDNGVAPGTYNELWIDDSIGGGCTGLGKGAGGTDRFDRRNSVSQFHARALSSKLGVPVSSSGYMRIHDATRWDDRFTMSSSVLSANSGAASTVVMPNGGTVTHASEMEFDTVRVPYYDNFTGQIGISISVAGATTGALFLKPTGTGTSKWKVATLNLGQTMPVGTSVVLTGVTTGGTIVINKLELSSSAGGIASHNACGSGSGASDWANIAGGGGYNFLRQERDNNNAGYPFEYDVVHIAFGLFDAAGTVANFKANMQVIHDYFPNSDIILHAMPVPGQYAANNGATWLAFIDAYFDLADLWDVPLVDVQGVLGGYAQEVLNGYTADTTAHLLQPAYSLWAQATSKLANMGNVNPPQGIFTGPAFKTTTPGPTLDITSNVLGGTRTYVLNSNLTVTVNAVTPSPNKTGDVTLIFRQPSSGTLYNITWPSTLEWIEDATAPSLPQAYNGILLVDLMWTGDLWLAMPGRFQL